MFKILSLDGGGIRGAFIAAYLAKIQQIVGRPLIQYFDLIAGSSTGGLIAVALGMGLTPAEIRDLYDLEVPKIFKRTPPKLNPIKRSFINAMLTKIAPGLDAEWLYHAKYDSAALQAALESRLGDRRLGDASCRLVIPSVDLTAGQIVVFKTPHRPNFVRDRHFRAVDVILATAAAPTYFSNASIDVGSRYCDGGLWANNPALVGYVEAIKILKECTRPSIDPIFSHEEIHLLSIGTGRGSYFMDPHSNESGLKWWAPQLLNVGGEAQSEGIHWQMEYLLGERYARIDFDIPDGNWALDSIENLDALLHLGTQKAIDSFPKLRSTFFSEISTSYVPFD